MLLRKLTPLLVLFLLVPLQWAEPQAASAPAGQAASTVLTRPAFDVKAAVDAGSKAASKVGELVSSHIIARPQEDLLKAFLGEAAVKNSK